MSRIGVDTLQDSHYIDGEDWRGKFLMNELLAYLEARNAETQVWIDAGPGRWATLWHTDMEHWAECGIRTVEDFLQMIEAEHEKEMRKAAYDRYDYTDDGYSYLDFDQEDEFTTVADHNYWMAEDYYSKADLEQELAYEEYQMDLLKKKWGVPTLDLVPTHYEQMAVKAGYMEY